MKKLNTTGAANGGAPEFITRNAAAKLLNVAPTTVSKLADRNQIRVRRIKGHSRQWFDKRDILSLLEVGE